MTASTVAGYALVGGLALIVALGVACIPLECVRWWRARRRVGLDEHVRRALEPSNCRRVPTPESKRGAW